MKALRKIICFLYVLFVTITSHTQGVVSNNVTDREKYQSKFDTLLFNNEHLENLQNINEILNKFKSENRQVFFYNKDWESISFENASFINTVSQLNDSLFIIRDYFISGKIQMTGIYKKLKDTIDWSKMNQWKRWEAGARKIDKFVHWNQIGLLDHIQYYKYDDFKEGYGSSFRLNIEDFQISFGTDYSIKNTSKLKIEELFIQDDDDDKSYLLPDYFGGIKAIYIPELTFIFKENTMIVQVDKIIKSDKIESAAGSFSPIFSTKNYYSQDIKFTSDLGTINVKLTDFACDDSEFNSFYLVSNSGQILIEGLLNFELFATDSDGDGIDEIYIFSFRSCSNSLKVIRIRK